MLFFDLQLRRGGKILRIMSALIRSVSRKRSFWETFRISVVMRSFAEHDNAGSADIMREWSEAEFRHNVRDIRSFSGTQWKKNLGKGRAEPRTVYPLLYAPTTEGRRAQRGTERSGVSIFPPILVFSNFPS